MRLKYLFLLPLVLAGCKSKEVEKEIIRPVFYQEINLSSVGERRSFSGVVQARLDSKLSFKVGGLIDGIDVQMGDTVKAGEIIARLDDDDYQVNYSKSEASLKNAEAQMHISQSAMTRMEKLYIRNNVSLNDYEAMKARYETAESLVRTARAQMTAARNQLDYTVLRAPFSGVISIVLSRENELIGPGVPVVIVASIKDPEVATAVTENIVGQIKQGDAVTVRLIAPDETPISGVVSEISPGSANVSNYPVVIRLKGSGEHLLPGMTCTVTFSLTEQAPGRDNSILTIVPDALGNDYSGHYVYIAVETEEATIYSAVKRSVVVGRLKPEGYEVVDGLETGDLVITAGLSFLYDGKKVKLITNK